MIKINYKKARRNFYHFSSEAQPLSLALALAHASACLAEFVPEEEEEEEGSE